MQLKRIHLAEAFSLIKENKLWDELSEETQEAGNKVLRYLEELKIDRLKIPEPINKPLMNMTTSEHAHVLVSTLDLQSTQSSFWQYVINITWVMILLEKNPEIVQQIKQGHDLENILGSLGIMI
jgi:hypothetical protein